METCKYLSVDIQCLEAFHADILKYILLSFPLEFLIVIVIAQFAVYFAPHDP